MNKTKNSNYINNMSSYSESESEYLDLNLDLDLDLDIDLDVDVDSDLNPDLSIINSQILANIESNKNTFISKKAILDDKLNKNLNIVNDFENFFYLTEKKHTQDTLYSNISINILKNRRFPTLKVAIPLNFLNLKKNNESLKENIILKFNKKQNKDAILLNSTKGGFNVFYKGILGFITKDQVLKGIKGDISYNNMLLFEKELNVSKTKVSNCLMNIYFQTIKHNFAKTKRRRINFVETTFTFNNKKYEKNRKNFKTKNN
jgi:hypothetical protein